MNLLTKGWRWNLGGAAMGVFVAAGFLAVTPPQFEAVALVQVGHVGQLGKLILLGHVGQLVQSGQMTVAPVESLARVVERVMLPGFRDDIIIKSGWVGENKGNVFRASLSARVSKSNDLIELRVNGLSRDEAMGSVKVTIDHLAALHRIVAQPLIENLRAELLEISAEAKETERALIELDQSSQLLKKEALQRDNLAVLVLSEHIKAEKKSRLKELQREEKQYREWIAPAGRAVTALIAEPSVSENPVFPNAKRTLSLGVLSGFVLGFFGFAFQRMRRNPSVSSPSDNTPLEGSD